MAKFTKKESIKKITGIVVAGVGVALIVSAVVMFSKHSNEILLRSETEAVNRGQESVQIIDEKFRTYVDVASSASGGIQNATSTEDVENYVGSLKILLNDSGVMNVRYFLGENIYTDSGVYEAPDDLAFVYRNSTPLEEQKSSYVGLDLNAMTEFDVTDGKVMHFEFYSPVKNNSYIDGIALYYDTSTVQHHLGTTFKHSDALFSVVTNDRGNILAGDENLDKLSLTEALSQFNVYDSDSVNFATNSIKNRECGTKIVKINGLNHVLSIQNDRSGFLNDILVCELYECSMLAKNTSDLINAIIAIIVVFFVIILLILSYLVTNHFKLQKQVNNSESYDIKLNCLNRYGFEKEATQILSRQEGLYYAVIVASLRHYKFLLENFGNQEVSSLLDYIKLTFQKTCKIEETYGHVENGEFLILLHAKNREDLIDRLKIHAFLANQYKGAHKFSVGFKYGIYEHQDLEKSSVSKMIDYANEANNTITKATVENVDMQFNFYNDDLRKIRLINEDMELRQDAALRDGEFQIFYQAKYNLKTKKQDGAEALVRWYDAKTGEYNKPALFMALFESNGFIEKLDKYVYTKVCEYISYSLSSGRKVFPVSVNVSRITATQPDFADYYIKTKQKYGIANGAITIEFTESFAYENYDVLKEIVNRLHKGGFKTSIDDFGCGYSSYRILKELPMDEIKLDKFFIDYSENPERINSIFESVISLAKKLNMKVTQEGVEKEEDVELLKKLGCDVIQGYVYSHPLSLTDYLAFVENTKDHNL